MTSFTYESVRTWLVERLDVLGDRTSVARVAIWTVVCFLIISWVVRPDPPSPEGRDIAADAAPTDVTYVAPQQLNDIAGFLAPATRSDDFDVAWIGGSEVKLEGVSVPSEFRRRVDAVGDRPLGIDVYSSVAMRVADAYLAAMSAMDNGADAIVVALNPTWTRDEFSLRRWVGLDVSDGERLLADRRTAALFPALVSPSDAMWRVLAESAPLMRARSTANEIQSSWLDRFDALHHRDDPPPEAGDPRLPGDSTSFWLYHEGTSRADTSLEGRIVGIVDGFGEGGDVSAGVLSAIVDRARDDGVLVYFYATPLAPRFVDDPRYAGTASELERRWAAFADDVDADSASDPTVVIASELLSRRLDPAAAFNDAIHPADAGPIADLLVADLCSQWERVNPAWRCTP